MTEKPQTFISFDEFAFLAESYGMTPGELAEKVGIQENGIRVVVTGDGKFWFFDERGIVSCSEGFEITNTIGLHVRELGIENLTIPNSVTSIGEWAFYDCSSLKSISIPNSVKTIGDHAFSFCTSLESISIPNSVKSIGDEVFSGCYSLSSVVIPKSVETIGNYAFSNCSSLKSVSIPDSVKSVGKWAFSNCSSLKSVSIPDSVKIVYHFSAALGIPQERLDS